MMNVSEDRWGLSIALDKSWRDLKRISQKSNPRSPWTEEEAEAALAAATARGWCELTSTKLPEAWTGELPLAAARAASERLILRMERWIKDVDLIEENWGNAVDELQQAEADKIVLAPFSQMMDAWAAYLAIDDALQCALEDNEPDWRSLSGAVSTLVESRERYESALENAVNSFRGPLSLVVDTGYLQTCRDMLSEPYSLSLPWWLDGTVESIFARDNQPSLPVVTAPTEWKEKVDRARQEMTSGPTIPSLTEAEGRFAHSWFLWPAPRILAADKSDESARLIHLDWRSPDGRVHATLVVNPRDASNEPLRMNFDSDDDEALNLAGQRAVLAGVPALVPIDAQGNADFSREAIRQAARDEVPLTLEVASELWLVESQS